uniref:IKBKB interacting protein n=1 Tax=Hippocampus comes TaxID=109280 RepID=A0A3Q2XLZ1_HIPCM
MPGEVKQRKKKQSDHVAADPANKQDEDKKVNRELQTAGVLYLVSVRYPSTNQQMVVCLAPPSRYPTSAPIAPLAPSQRKARSASGDLQAVNARFLNVTETWQERLAAASSELASLKAESREAHAGATERVNEAERRTRSLAEKLEELEDSTRRNARAMERAEEDDAKRAQAQLDWNTQQIHKMDQNIHRLARQEADLSTQLQEQLPRAKECEEQLPHVEEALRSIVKLGAQLDWNTQQIHKMDQNIHRLARQEADLSTQLQEQLPRAKECEEQLPHVEEALRSIVKLGADLSGAERRIEEVTLQVFSAEDNMLKSLNRILAMRQEMDALQARGTILKMKSELAVVREAVHELTMVLRGEQTNEEEEEEEPDEEWEEPAETPQEDVAQ